MAPDGVGPSRGRSRERAGGARRRHPWTRGDRASIGTCGSTRRRAAARDRRGARARGARRARAGGDAVPGGRRAAREGDPTVSTALGRRASGAPRRAAQPSRATTSWWRAAASSGGRRGAARRPPHGDGLRGRGARRATAPCEVDGHAEAPTCRFPGFVADARRASARRSIEEAMTASGRRDRRSRGVGKSTLARAPRRALGLPYVNTGLMYRALAAAALRAGVRSRRRSDALLDAMRRVRFIVRVDPPGELEVEGYDPMPSSTTVEVESMVSRVASHPTVRARMRREQRELGRGARGGDGGTGHRLRGVPRRAGEAVPAGARPSCAPTRRVAERDGDRPDEVAAALRGRDARDARTTPHRARAGTRS